MVFLSTVDWEEVEDTGTDETGFAWLTGTDRLGSTVGLVWREDSSALLGRET